MKIFKFISNYITKHAKTLGSLVTPLMLVAAVIAAFASVWGIVVGYKDIDQQEKIYKTTKAEQEYPFFQYLYDQDAKVFKVSSYDYVRINSVRWSFPEYENERMNNRISLFAINSLTKDLSRNEIRDYFAMKLSDKLSVKRIVKLVKEDIECLFFAYAQEGIPAIAKINYDLRDQQGLTSKDLILFKRLDTKFPALEFQKKIESDEELTNSLNKYEANLRYAYEPTLEILNNLEPNRSNKIYDGTCSIQFNQPED